MTRDWHEWHRAYDQPESPLTQRLGIVQDNIRTALDAAPPGPIRVVSMCAGEARDILGVLADHPRRADVTGRLVELDPGLAEIARAHAPAGIDVLVGDAGDGASYVGAVPADLVLVCGVFGNVTDDDIWHTIERLPSLCKAGATVIWTRHRRPPDMTPATRAAFEAAGFEEVSFTTPAPSMFTVGADRYLGPPVTFTPNRLYTFVGYDRLVATCEQCHFSYHIARDEIVPWLRSDARQFVNRLQEYDGDAVRVRPAPDVWSPLEYACHVRDVLRVQRDRVLLALAEEQPTFIPMRRDERVVDDRYNAQDPAVVAQDILDAADALVATLDSLDHPGWERTGTYNYPTPQVRTVEWIAAHTVHELLHHRVDIGTLA